MKMQRVKRKSLLNNQPDIRIIARPLRADGDSRTGKSGTRNLLNNTKNKAIPCPRDKLVMIAMNAALEDVYKRVFADSYQHGAPLSRESLCEPYAVRVARTVTRGVRVYTCSVVVGPTHPICSMIYGSTGATHFDQLAKILTGYEITGARSSGIFMGILSIAVGFLFKITAVPFHMWAPDIYEGSPTPVTAFLSIAPKISISANISRVSIYGSYGATLQQIFFFCSIASMILGALAAMAQTKVKRPLAHSSIGHVGYIRTGLSCGTIEGIQSLLIGIFIYALMTIDAFAIVLALRQTRVKYIADLGALAKTNPISAITFSITMFSYAGIPPLAGFCSKFYLFFAALGCGAYFLAPVGVVTSVIGRWAAGRLPRVSQFGGPKAVLRAPDT
ncbi:PREDICTED: NADH-ubiquinone oxidoreductase chain 2 [Prunus mume]|nr:PREDICTED: NADH-ubiquinone oxidoreductase chain 2 [Prunus mume]